MRSGGQVGASGEETDAPCPSSGDQAYAPPQQQQNYPPQQQYQPPQQQYAPQDQYALQPMNGGGRTGDMPGFFAEVRTRSGVVGGS